MVDERKIGRTARTAFVLTGWLVLTLAAIQQDVHAASKSPATARSYFVYVGTDTSTGSKGVYSYRFDPKTGQLTPIGVAAEVATPFFLATDPQYRFFYATTERGEGRGPNMFKVNGHVSSYSIDRKTGALTFLNRVETGGGGPAPPGNRQHRQNAVRRQLWKWECRFVRHQARWEHRREDGLRSTRRFGAGPCPARGTSCS